MIAKLLQPFLIPIAFVAGLLLMFCGYGLYDTWLAYPAVKKEALQGYVLETTLIAKQAELDAVRRQIGLQMIAQSQFETVLKHVQELADANQAQNAQEIADYEKKLADAGRSCPIDADDIKWLRNSK
ncbi:hypothetical protein [Phyllobacterium myrsinacearum]|uniref:Uncharacterized protein n=1 Tax=Phyllobacterium myrsinacearum TaxID=28101 RepID=A0A839EWR5_9HYPH|nr:hypothetical protein [Phyllobacterium myrsinacearum]MBA8881746.1 hypothetical protein [Phyllobacterium myrsinacearum]